MVSKLRSERIAERIHDELSSILLMDVSDPRIEPAHITRVRVDRELAYATIYISALEGSQRAEEILEGLNHARGFLRTKLTKQIPLRSFPRLRFVWDQSMEQADRIDRLLASLDDGTGDSESTVFENRENLEQNE
ncbi:MAG: 30S ribosome-binding factor RbfA [Anaerolineae bacterium]|nr:30S ribosome-binding factor RbfA [Anaerolineae bacterium]